MDNLQVKIFGLSFGQHRYTFEVDDALFARHPGSLIEHGKATIELTLDKTETMITALFDIEGQMELECDRSLDLYWQPFTAQEQIIYKLGDENKELTEEIQVIERGTIMLDLEQAIYEFITLAIPARKLKPEFQQEEAAPGENLDLRPVYRSIVEDDAPDIPADPQWDVLRKLYDN